MFSAALDLDRTENVNSTGPCTRCPDICGACSHRRRLIGRLAYTRQLSAVGQSRFRLLEGGCFHMPSVRQPPRTLVLGDEPEAGGSVKDGVGI